MVNFYANLLFQTKSQQDTLKIRPFYRIKIASLWTRLYWKGFKKLPRPIQNFHINLKCLNTVANRLLS